MYRLTPTSPWIAWPSGADPADVAARLRVAHELFMSGGAASGDPGSPRARARVRRVVLESWLRSRGSGVDPETPRPPVDVAGADLAAFRRGHALAPLMPIARRLLLDGGGSEGMLVALVDDAGRLLWVEGDRVVRSAVERVGFVEGAQWREQDTGTNAPGMALATDRAVQVFGAEHFTRAMQPWSCTAAPVHDPVTGRLLGVLDVTGRDPAASPQMHSLVRATVAAMESELAVRALRARLDDTTRRSRVRRARSPDAAAEALPGITPGDPGSGSAWRLEVLGTLTGTLLRGGVRQVATLRHAELLLLLSRNPTGLTGDALAALLHPGTLSSVTVRAEMSRLRHTAGDLLGSSRPYRLTDRPEGRIRTDIDDVHERLSRDDVAGAVELYRGPVLPRSEAPGVIELRTELDAEMRAALARTNDPTALEAWTRSPTGVGDWAAWQRLLTLHPEGSPGWIRARAHADLLDRELTLDAGPDRSG